MKTSAMYRASLLGMAVLATPWPVAARAESPPAPVAAPAPASAFTTRLVDVDGRHVAFHVAPGRGPVVVFISGGGMDGSAWNGVAGVIGARTGSELVTYDRAGFGDSDEDPRPTVIGNEVDDLEAGLQALGVTGPIVLVAHSYGGEVATTFADRDPARIKRAVLVDASIPAFFTAGLIKRMQATFPTGTPTNKEERSQAALMKAYPAMMREFHGEHWPASIPTTVIVSEHPPFVTEADNKTWIDDHRAFARAPNRSFILAERSGHIIMNDRPDLVENAIVEAVERSRRP